MRKLINSTYITLDGVIENPMWSMPYFDGEFAESQTSAADALLMGRVTYEGFAAVWPTMDESDPSTGAAYFNSVKKYVASTTLTETTWNAEVLAGDAVDAVAALKESGDGTLVKFGNGPFSRALVEAGLLDELHLSITPFVAGSGESLLSSIGTTNMNLTGVTDIGNGVVVLTYAPGRPGQV